MGERSLLTIIVIVIVIVIIIIINIIIIIHCHWQWNIPKIDASWWWLGSLALWCVDWSVSVSLDEFCCVSFGGGG